ncbi:MAG: aminotransferase class I/II-fold pyridoxal phosphate-dependent enzyme [Limimaricola sp.]|uniref:pyridoxal phosphate-dependent aminotransferase n=1 Tax=Limimaricola sp. TaxID=2211665 RepID=UPI001D56ED89|nr:aminotransferase class I/II-fold pyridoxal phosphate-dependent enzyme [Limimaricola sp.]MBI1418243.1 aminotransferase class I/II-fold pyridoxal phosphate-dependent enzyme [Limimaricola sp.]
MKSSQRISHLTGGGSDGWDVFYRARRMKAAGQPVIELTIGEHDIRTAPDILAAMDAAARAGHTGYASVPGTDALRKAVATRIATRTGVATGPENILITPGGQAGLFAAAMATLDPGDRALFVDPYYVTYPGTLRAAGGVPVPVAARPEHAFQPQAADLAVVAPDARVLLVNSPNNPTGAVYDAATLADIAGVVTDHDLWLISDEVYDTQVWEGEHLSPRALPGMADRTLVVGSMSKSHAMTGSRIGWVCGPEEIIVEMINLATHTTYGVPGYIQDAATFALGQGETPEEAVAAPFRRRRAITARLVAGQNVVRAAPMQGAMYAMLDIRATGLSGEGFANALLDAERVAVMPGESFGAAAAGHVRVALTVDDAAFEDALGRLLRFAAARAGAVSPA